MLIVPLECSNEILIKNVQGMFKYQDPTPR